MDCDQSEEVRLIPTKRKSKRISVPTNQHGFRAQTYTTIYRPRPPKRKIMTKYEEQNVKECFLNRLTLCFNAMKFTPANLINFKGINRAEWQKIECIFYRTKQRNCCICFEEYVAPQMLFCGHVFCWHCLQMHQYISLKALNCPICNETIDHDELKFCKIIEKSNDLPVFNLMIKRPNDPSIYSAESGIQDAFFAHLLRMTPKGIYKLFEEEQLEITKAHEAAEQSIGKWIYQVKMLSNLKMSEIYDQSQLDYSVKPQQINRDEFILKVLPEAELTSKQISRFYQQKSGRFMFIHPICDSFLRSSQKEHPTTLSREILLLEESNCNSLKKWKSLSHIHPYQDAVFAFIDLKGLISAEQVGLYEQDLEKHKQEKIQLVRKQQREAVRLDKIYQEEQAYIKLLREQQATRFFDIKAPTTLEPGEIDSHTYFPSLIQTIKVNHSVPQERGKEVKEAVKEAVMQKEAVKEVKEAVMEVKEAVMQKEAVKEVKEAVMEVKEAVKEKEAVMEVKEAVMEKEAVKEKEAVMEKKPIKNGKPEAQIDLQQFPEISLVEMKKGKKSSLGKMGGKKRSRKEYVDMTDYFFRQEND